MSNRVNLPDSITFVDYFKINYYLEGILAYFGSSFAVYSGLIKDSCRVRRRPIVIYKEFILFLLRFWIPSGDAPWRVSTHAALHAPWRVSTHKIIQNEKLLFYVI